MNAEVLKTEPRKYYFKRQSFHKLFSEENKQEQQFILMRSTWMTAYIWSHPIKILLQSLAYVTAQNK